MCNNLSANNGNKPGFFKNSLAVCAGGVAGGAAVTAARLPINLQILKGITKINRSLTKDEVKFLNTAGDKILNNSGLAEKGVKIVRDIEISPVLRSVFKTMEKFLPKKIVKFFKIMDPIYMAKMGKNAFFSPELNQIMHLNKMALSQFHELGHAMNNYNIGGKLGHLLTKVRSGFNPVTTAIVGTILSVIALTALFKHKKAEGEKPVGFWDKTTTFIKNNAGKLTTLTLLPMVLEEGMASLKGEKALKALGKIPANLMKKVKISNRLGLATYAIGAIGAGLAVMLGVKFRDKIAQPNVK